MAHDPAVSNPHGSSRVGIRGCIGNVTGRIGSGQEVFRSHGSGSGRADPIRLVWYTMPRIDLTREKYLVTYNPVES